MKSTVTERPILFSGEMVRAILDGRKTQTRRVIKPQPMHPWRTPSGWQDGDDVMRCPYGQPGDRLWVRETWATARVYDDIKPSLISKDAPLWWDADRSSLRHLGAKMGKTRPSIFMPRWASRITLEVVSRRAEQLEDISREDAQAEGVESTLRSYGVGWRDYRGAPGAWFLNAGDSYATLWDSINAKRGYGWEENPWVWVIEFKICGIDK